MPRDRHGNVIEGSYGPTGAPSGQRAASPPPASTKEVGDLTSLLKQAAKGGTPGFASSRRSAAPMKSVGTPGIGGKRNRRGRDTQFRGAETRVSRPRSGKSSGRSGVQRRGAQSPRGAATAGPPMSPNDPSSFRPPIPATPSAQSGRAALPSAPGQAPPGAPMGASVAGAASPIARAAMSGAPAVPGVRRPTRPGGMLGVKRA
jgi:hypothetical protein